MDIAHITQRLAGCHLSSCTTHKGGKCDCGAAAELSDDEIMKISDAFRTRYIFRGQKQQSFDVLGFARHLQALFREQGINKKGLEDGKQ